MKKWRQIPRINYYAIGYIRVKQFDLKFQSCQCQCFVSIKGFSNFSIASQIVFVTELSTRDERCLHPIFLRLSVVDIGHIFIHHHPIRFSYLILFICCHW